MPGRQTCKDTIADQLNKIEDGIRTLGRQLDADHINFDAAGVVDAIKEQAEAMRKPIETIVKEGG